MKVLIADDDKTLTHILSARLKAIGFTPIAAHDAVQAWVAIQRNVPTVVVLDIHMPGGTGRAVLKSLKRSLKTQHIPVIAISSLSEMEVAPELKALGAESFMPKPVDLLRFEETIKRLSGGLPEVHTNPVDRAGKPQAGTALERNSSLTLASPMKVLVADDDPGTVRTIESLLSKWDYQVVSVRNGEEALKVLEAEEPPQIAVLDWMMPIQDGLQVCKRIRQRTTESYCYVLLLTSKGDKQEIVQGMEAGADDYVVKPFHAAELKVRMAAGRRIVELQEELLARSGRLASALQLLNSGR